MPAASALQPLIGLSLLLYSLTGWGDWADPTAPQNVPVSPANGAEVHQNPPGFDWNRLKPAAEYQLVVRHENGKEYKWKTRRNWYLPSESLPAGNYSWYVQPIGPGTEQGQSNRRKFRISNEAIRFIVPDDDALLSQLRSRGRPRSLPIERDEPAWRSKVLARHQKAVEILNGDTHRAMARPALSQAPALVERKSGNEARWAESTLAIRKSIEPETRQLKAAALLWRITGDQALREEALKRGDALASLDPNGSTGYKSQDQASRDIAESLARALDWLGGEIPQDARTRWLQSIASRAQAIYQDLFGGDGRFYVMRKDSHGTTNLGYLAHISMLTIGDLPEAETWFRESFRFNIHSISPWGGEEGGYGNSSAYATWSLPMFVSWWDSIQAATGVDVYAKPWARGFARYFVYFEPPGTPRYLFGDGAEQRPDFSMIKGYVSRQPSSLGAWYVGNIPGTEDLITSLAGPVSLPVEEVQAKPPAENMAAFHDIGWVAMHSRMADGSRTSIYFRASPDAAFSHSHADNNSFVLNSNGEPLLIDSGYYDWYGSPHWKGWYWRTKAHNAITFDGGKGQAEKSGEQRMTAIGRLVDARSNGRVDFTEGDAIEAYEGQLLQARRRLWYLRGENTLVVQDSLRSAVPRQFEWNVHALDSFVIKNPGSIEIKRNAARACIDMIQPGGMEFVQNNRFDPPPESGPSRGDQWHGRFQNKERQVSMEFLAVIRVGCQDVGFSIKDSATGRQIKVGKEIIDVPH